MPERPKDRPYRVYLRRLDGAWSLSVQFPSIDQAQAFARAQAAMFGRERVSIRCRHREVSQ